MFTKEVHVVRWADALDGGTDLWLAPKRLALLSEVAVRATILDPTIVAEDRQYVHFVGQAVYTGIPNDPRVYVEAHVGQRHDSDGFAVLRYREPGSQLIAYLDRLEQCGRFECSEC